jgi:hypothetical protein
MGRTSIPAVLRSLATPGATEDKAAALRSLKNEIVGHEQRKELAVTSGVVAPLARLLCSAHANANGDGEAWAVGRHADEVRLQATLVVGSLANGEHTTPDCGWRWLS